MWCTHVALFNECRKKSPQKWVNHKKVKKLLNHLLDCISNPETGLNWQHVRERRHLCFPKNIRILLTSHRLELFVKAVR